MQKALIEIVGLYSGHGIDHRLIVRLGLALLDFGDIEDGQGRIEMKMQALRIAGLGVAQARKLFSFAKNNFALKAGFSVFLWRDSPLTNHWWSQLIT